MMRLATISIFQHDGATHIFDRFSGQNRVVSDYLLDDVIEHLPDQTIDFLLKPPLPNDKLEQLVAATEGWAAGVVLQQSVLWREALQADPALQCGARRNPRYFPRLQLETPVARTSPPAPKSRRGQRRAQLRRRRR